MMKGHSVPAKTRWVAPRALVVRDSSNLAAVESIQVARALRFITESLSDKRLAPARAAEAAGVSRRALYYAFTQHLHRSFVRAMGAAPLAYRAANAEPATPRARRGTGRSRPRMMKSSHPQQEQGR